MVIVRNASVIKDNSGTHILLKWQEGHCKLSFRPRAVDLRIDKLINGCKTHSVGKLGVSDDLVEI